MRYPLLSWILGIAITLILFILWILGFINEQTAFVWFIVAVFLNTFSVVHAVFTNLIYQFSSILGANFFYYVWVEFDAPGVVNPFLFYGSFFAIFAGGVVWHYLRNHRNLKTLAFLAVLDLILNGLFCIFDVGLLKL